MPSLRFPYSKVKDPKISVKGVNAPKIGVPSIEVPGIQAPTISGPKIAAPAFNVKGVSATGVTPPKGLVTQKNAGKKKLTDTRGLSLDDETGE